MVPWLAAGMRSGKALARGSEDYVGDALRGFDVAAGDGGGMAGVDDGAGGRDDGDGAGDSGVVEGRLR